MEPALVNTEERSGGEPSDRPLDAQLLTVDDLARVLRVPKATIYRWRCTGDGPPGYTIGRYVRFRWPDVEACLAGRADDSAREHS